MRPRTLFAVTAAFVCSVAAPPGVCTPVDASAEARSEAGLNRAFFRLPQGTIRVNYPDDTAAGDTISGTVYVEPSGSDRQQLDQNGAELSGYVVEMPGQRVPVSGTHFLWSIPARVAPGVVAIVLRDRSNRIVTQCNLPVHPRPLPPAAGPVDLPLGGQAGGLSSAWGPFSPSSETSITVGGRNAPLIAQSPRKVVFQVPPDIAGQTELEIRNGGSSARGTFRSLGLKLSATRRTMATGTTTTISVLVSGLQGLKEPASLLIVNHEPDVVNLSGGPVQRIAISPAEVQPDGTFQLTRTLAGEHRGGYRLTVLVSLPPASQVPLERISVRTIDSWSRSTEIEVTPEAQSRIISDVVAARPQLDTLFQAQLLFQAEPASLLDWLVRDYCFDLRDQKLRLPNAAEIRPPRPSFASFVVLAADSEASVSLQGSDVSHFSFLQYLARFLASHAPSRPFGSLFVTSQPDKQLITIDQATGPDHFTARMFVVSVGDHTVKVANCQEHVTVSPNQQATVNCPRAGALYPYTSR